MSRSHGPDLILMDSADTLVYIDDTEPHDRSRYSLQPQRAVTIPHRVHSQRLLSTGSAYFRKLFEPRAQSRVLKRCKLDGTLPDGVKFVIDLTPPTTDDEGVRFTTELSCPLGLRKWALAQNRWTLPSHLVGGIDDGLEHSSSSDEPGIPVEYSEARNRRGIAHVLQALEGFKPQLNTPCKLWTFLALAKLYGIAHHPWVKVPILTWIYEGRNSLLIEMHPEIAYGIACSIQCDYLCQDSFSILVGEASLRLMAEPNATLTRPWDSHETLYGRVREVLDDEDRQRVEYASQSFKDHVIDTFLELVGSKMQWLERLPAVHKVLLHEAGGPPCPLASELIRCLKNYVRHHVIDALNTDLVTWKEISVLHEPDDDYPGERFLKAYTKMHYTERIMSRTFWKNLGSKNWSNLLPSAFVYLRSANSIASQSVADLGRHLQPFRAQENTKIGLFDTGDLVGEVNRYNAHTGSGRPVYGADLIIVGDTGELESAWNNTLGHLSSEAPSGPICHLGGLYPEGYIDFNPQDFFSQLSSYLHSISDRMRGSYRSEMDQLITDCVSCLTANEVKYLPLWAGGNDDGSGGVFADLDIPNAELAGFATPGPGIHMGSSVASKPLSDYSSTTYESTVQAASHGATGGFGTDVMSFSMASERSGIEQCIADFEDLSLEDAIQPL
ncbi:uncharacterized protein BO66DRAFT_389200 [Aspergillus aculeatinus CBS 121060]|uniref:Uncharacterized protein n=1 Tax=Aspergillus aculeatinus CBS 121060 TaxID=1448322 RepID=A0ACD1HHF8_9EURO|nr:hypothetical protein BO66DRAFT_389200 [Aspergillus aculeatinus CBS 121060]RAH73083.1 hypothetical protein BO66DRAFT_389200 [Aspergillus aculeatinus CBS 121060]